MLSKGTHSAGILDLFVEHRFANQGGRSDGSQPPLEEGGCATPTAIGVVRSGSLCARVELEATCAGQQDQDTCSVDQWSLSPEWYADGVVQSRSDCSCGNCVLYERGSSISRRAASSTNWRRRPMSIVCVCWVPICSHSASSTATSRSTRMSSRSNSTNFASTPVGSIPIAYGPSTASRIPSWPYHPWMARSTF